MVKIKVKDSIGKRFKVVDKNSIAYKCIYRLEKIGKLYSLRHIKIKYDIWISTYYWWIMRKELNNDRLQLLN